MTVATSRGTGSPVDEAITPPKVLRQRRMRPGLLGLAVLLVALGGLGSAFAVASVRATGSYLAVAQPVPVGAELTADDVMVVEVAGGQGLAPVPARRLQEVLGMRAAVALTPRTLLTMGQLTDKPMLSPGQQQISLGLEASKIPARRLHPGDPVLLISTPGRNAPAATASTRFKATVIESAGGENNRTVVYLALSARDVPAVVALAAENRIALVLDAAA